MRRNALGRVTSKKGCPPTPDRGDTFPGVRHPLLRKMTLAGINATRPPRRPTFAREGMAMIETRVGLQAALHGLLIYLQGDRARIFVGYGFNWDKGVFRSET